MAITCEAIYENGVLKPARPLPLGEHEKVQVTIARARGWVDETAGILGCNDTALIDQVALDADFSYSPLGDA